MKRRRNIPKLMMQASGALLFALTACSTYNEPQNVALSAPGPFDAALSVEVSSSDSRSTVEKAYGGEVVVWEPEAGLAVLGLQRDGLRPLTADAEPNQAVMYIPEARAEGQRWREVTDSWGGGFTARTGGRSAWSSGGPTTFTENLGFWEQIRLSEAQTLAPALGSGVKVAVIDTGLDLSHPAFAGKLAPASEWRDFVDGDLEPHETSGSNYGHGTGVAGVIAQVAPNATILPIRALNGDGLGDVLNVTVAVVWAVYKGADVINLSLGTDIDLSVLKAVLGYARDRGIIVVASVGNSGDNHIVYPARYGSETVGVGSVNSADIKSAFSAYGPELELLAPGEDIFTPAPGNRVASWNGTSSAAAIVSGALALALGERSSVAPRELSRQLEETADSVSGLPENWAYGEGLGRGRINLEAFLTAVKR